MQFTHKLYASLLLTAALTMSTAAQSYTGEDVTVNRSATGRTYLLYPGGKYGRYVPHLLQPGEMPHQMVHLHMPVHQHPVAAKKEEPVAALPAPPKPAPVTPVVQAPKPMKQATTVTSDPGSLPEDSAARLIATSEKSLPKSGKVASAPAAASVPPSSNMGATTVPFSFGGSSAAVAVVPQPAVTPSNPPPAPPHVSGPTPAAPPAPATTTRASAPAQVAHAAPESPAKPGLKRQTMIPFAAGASSPSSSDIAAIHTLASTLSTVLSVGGGRVQLDAYGGPRGDKSSDSRRLSLKRALVVRELLIEDGIPSEKIDVRAMGGSDDDGATDRVDVFVRA